MVELVLAVWMHDKNTFQLFRRFQRPVLLSNSVFKMDHDSEGNCYCKGY